MNIIEKLKGVFRRMFSAETIQTALELQPTISNKMKTSIELWERMYKNESPWVIESPDARIVSLGLPAMIASEKARTATIEMKVKVTGDSERADYIKTQFDKVVNSIRKNLEYGIALGGLVVKPYVVNGPDDKLKIEVNYVKATDFYPLSFSSEGVVTEAAFIDRIITKDQVFSKLEHHKLVGTTLTIQNIAFATSSRGGVDNANLKLGELGHRISLKDVPEWENVPEVVPINNIDELLFAYFKMPQANTIDLNSPLGVSGFSRAVDLIRNADEQYSNLLWEFEGGQLAVDVDRTALNPTTDVNGNPIPATLPKLQQRLFRHDLDMGVDEFYNVFSPVLRDGSIINGLNTILMRIEDVCDLSRGTLSSVTYAEARTATELKILKQRSFSANFDIQKELQRTLDHVVRIMDKYCDLYQIVPAGDFEVAYDWDDSIIVDKDAERQVDILDVNNNLLSRVEYRMKWMGETEQQAVEALNKIDQMALDKMKKEQETLMQQQDGPIVENQKRERAQESNETTD